MKKNLFQTLAEIVAQTLYYVRRLKFGNDYRPVSQNICISTPKFTIYPFISIRRKMDRLIAEALAILDAGWYQIRMSLGVSIDLSELSKKLEPQIYELGFLRDEVRCF